MAHTPINPAATDPQRRLLRRFGLATEGMTASQANRLITSLQKAGKITRQQKYETGTGAIARAKVQSTRKKKRQTTAKAKRTAKAATLQQRVVLTPEKVAELRTFPVYKTARPDTTVFDYEFSN